MHLIVQATILGLLTGGVYALMASGLTLAFGVMRVINVAQGAMIVAGAYVSYSLFTDLGIDPFLSIVIMAPFAFAVGATIQVVFLRPLRMDEREELSLLVTWAIALGIEGILGIVYQTTYRSTLPSYVNDSIIVRGYSISVVRLLAFAASAVILALLYLLLQRTRLGRAIRATVQNPTSAALLGIQTERVAAIGFGISAATATAAGAVFGMITPFNAGSHYDLISRLLTIIVLGGLGSLTGAVIASMVMGVGEAVLAVEISPTWSSIWFFAILILVLLIRPQGLLGTKERGTAVRRVTVAGLVRGGVVTAAFAAFPLTNPAPYLMTYALFTVMYMVLASAWNILGGYSGYLSLGHAAFFGIGAYAEAILFEHISIAGGYRPFYVIPLVGLGVAIASVPIGIVALRVRAATFAIVTISMLFIVQQLAFNLRGLTNGAQGMSMPLPPFPVQTYEHPFYYAMLAVWLGTMLLSWAVFTGKLGLTLFSIRDDEDRARGLGVHTTYAKTVAFAVSAGLTAMAGCIWAYYVGFIYPQFAIDPLVTIGAVLMAFLGGRGTVWGPTLGALILVPAQQYLAYSSDSST